VLGITISHARHRARFFVAEPVVVDTTSAPTTDCTMQPFLGYSIRGIVAGKCWGIRRFMGLSSMNGAT
jgi:hypothetical protein